MIIIENIDGVKGKGVKERCIRERIEEVNNKISNNPPIAIGNFKRLLSV